MLRGVRLAARQANASGGVLGRRIKVVPVDDQANPDLAASVVDEAADAGAVAVIGPYNSAVGVINLPLYLDSGIVPVHMTSSNATDGLGITVQPKDDQLAPSEAAYVQSSGASSVAMLVDPSEFTQDMADRLADSLRADGVAVTEIPIAEGQSDYNAEVTQALDLAPDLVYVSTYYPEGTKIATALQASAADGPACLMGLGNVDPAFVTTVDLSSAQRCVFNGVPAAEQMPGKRAAKFVRDYERAFDREPGVWGIFTYDSANVLFAALEEVGSTAFSPLLKELDRTRGFAGATGEISIDPKTGNRKVVPVYILEVDDTGTFVVADTN
jgi:ABC-type branched-subunit amino acid transport system substrate-binding protein